MAKLYREDLMIWKAPGAPRWYLLEREPFDKEGVKKGVHRFGTVGTDAIFASAEEAREELSRWPSREEEGADAHAG